MFPEGENLPQAAEPLSRLHRAKGGQVASHLTSLDLNPAVEIATELKL